MANRSKVLIGAVIGLALGAGLGQLVGWLVRSDNTPFFVAFGTLVGVCIGLVWTRAPRRFVLAYVALAAFLLSAVWLTPPRARIETPTSQPEGLTPDQARTLASLQKVDDYPLYTMRYGLRSGDFSHLGAPRTTEVVATDPMWACSLFAALGDPENRLYGRNFDWRYSPALLLFTDQPAADGYASVSMVDIAYLGFDDGALDLTTLPLVERRALLEAPFWPFDGMNEAGVAVGMAAVPQADERHDAGKPTIDSLRVIREVLDRAGSTDEAVTILSRYNIDWEGGPPLHYLVADRSGRAALVEYQGGQIVVLPNASPWHAATNFTLSAAAGDATSQCHRYDTLVGRLAAAEGQLNSRSALDLLQSVAQTEAATQWSVIYGISTGQVDVVMGRGYDQVHTFWLR